MTINESTHLPGDKYADATAALQCHAADISVYAALWSMRDDSEPCPSARRAANDAMDAIDAALAELYALRSRLVADIRASDDAAAARVDALLAARAGGAQ
jgi:hypothetical protein